MKEYSEKNLVDFLAKSKKPVVIILGSTASGKTDFSLEIAEKYNGEIINADSRQVYRDLDIVTAKIKKSEMKNIPHHLFDIRNVDENLNAAEWKKLAEEKIEEILSRGKLPIICGGTMMYVDSLVENFDFGGSGFDEDLRSKLEEKSCDQLVEILGGDIGNINPENHRHLVRACEVKISGGEKKAGEKKFDFLKIGIMWEREKICERIKIRSEKMFENGIVEEAKRISEEYNMNLLSLSSIGYSEALAYANGEISREEAIEKNTIRTRQYARRQMSWWKRDEEIFWIKRS